MAGRDARPTLWHIIRMVALQRHGEIKRDLNEQV